ncbi:MULTISPECIES: spore germination protein [Clostridium]|uniref:Spore germination protein B1 n=3 Tax=Clostridium TaxID=1485 RepID=A0A151ARV7_9CLOT|nr:MULTISPECIES: spore germination protein [Clostridium]KYH30381.1 spore germination protein B1 [Clostridium colicanis DSM 13634]PRR76458.1 Spore germination protein B1 [Clostridium thermopalmarium DSM 5974]PVZ28429.1 stage V sporulation protein AF [Clostridium thermopalmarium DSM 5974]
MTYISNKLDENKKLLKSRLPIDKSFDMIGREIKIGDREAFFVMLDGFAKDDIMLWIIERLQAITPFEISMNTISKLLKEKIAYIEVDTFKEIEKMEQMVLAGAIGLIIDGEEEGIILDAREYPVRGPEEPDLEKVTRGSRDGLVETIIFNTALIRRRIRDTKLVFELNTVGKRSKTDVVIGYIEDLADEKLVQEIKDRIKEIDVGALVMAEKTLEELLIKKKWYNPLPLARFTERPDVVAAHLMEGHIAIIVDTSPSVMILPATLFHFTQHAEDYYQTPITGTYIRWIRFLGMFSAFLLLPLWLLLVYNKEALPQSLQFLGPKEMGNIPLFIQFILLEFGLDLLRVSSIHTPSALSTSLGIIGGLILSEFAVKIGLFVPEAVVYMALAGIGTFATASVEFAMAIRIFRLFILILTGLFKNIGFAVGILVVFIIAFNTKSFKNSKRYTWPLIPFDWKALSHILFRTPIPKLGKDDKNQ